MNSMHDLLKHGFNIVGRQRGWLGDIGNGFQRRHVLEKSKRSEVGARGKTPLMSRVNGSMNLYFHKRSVFAASQID